MTSPEPHSGLHALAQLYGVDLTYHDIWGRERTVDEEPLLKVLQALGAPVYSAADVPSAHTQRVHSQWRQHLEPVHVAWDGRAEPITLRIPGRLEDSLVDCVLRTEDGAEYSWQVALSDRPTLDGILMGGAIHLAKQLSGLEHLPPGYHSFSIDVGGFHDESLIISAPRQAWTYAANTNEPRRWGVFMPLHALRTGDSQFGGNLSDLGRLTKWTANLGGSLVGTLPLLATFLDEPFDPSPYSPASRLFWNELFLDTSRMPESSAEGSTSRGTSAAPPSGNGRVDYRAWSESQRTMLEQMAKTFFEHGGRVESEFQEYVASNPRVSDYAQFRAVQERQRHGWVVWPEGPRDGHISTSDFDPERQRYHVYVQWRLHQQLSELANQSRRNGARLYLDFPLGVHSDSYDTWRERESFARGIAVGAPPDVFFTGGQNWGFPPPNPDAIRATGYAYLREALRNHMQLAGALRIDHIMGLLRLFWIPHGMGAADGVYVRYHADEQYAILSLESRRAECPVIGEDLGTVPDEVREAMTQHDFLRMYVSQFEMSVNADRALPTPSAASMASVNTHDTVLFGGFWEGRDIEIMRLLDLISDDDAAIRREERARLNKALVDFLQRAHRMGGEMSAAAALQGMLEHLAAGPAQILMVTLEDLWLEREPQNVPGTGDDWQNWRRKARLSFDEFASSPQVLDALNAIQHARQNGTMTS